MNTQVDRLQALLQRVQLNRSKPHAVWVAPVSAEQARSAEPSRAAAVPAPAPHMSAPAPHMPATQSPRGPDPTVRSGAPEPRAKPATATPLEMAVEGHFSRPVPAEPAAKPAVATASGSSQGVALVDVALPQPQKPIAHVVSKHPHSSAATFGDLLRRSLSLRPR
jgi:hypothetical protein